MPIGEIKLKFKVEFKWWALILMKVLPFFFKATRIKPNSKRWLDLIQEHGVTVSIAK